MIVYFYRIASFYIVLVFSLSLAGQETELHASSELQKRGFKVLKESNRHVIVQTSQLDLGQRVMFVRFVPDLDEYEVISQGVVKKKSDKLTMIEIDIDRNEKYPQRGDFAVTLGEPKVFDEFSPKDGRSGIITETRPVDILEAGYAQFGFLQVQGQLSSVGSDRTNSYKNINSLNSQGFSFQWVPDFLPRYGFEFESYTGPVSVIDYNLVTQPSSYSKSSLKLFYRNKKIQAADFRWKFFVSTYLSDFMTPNTDEYVISSKGSGLGLGLFVGYEWVGNTSSQPTHWWGTPQSIGLEASCVPQLDVADSSIIQRGVTASGSTQLSYSVNYSHQFFLDFVPWFKRYNIDVAYTVNNFKLVFSGKTKNPSNNIYDIPENGTYLENENLIKLTFGLRMEDWFGRALKPRSK